MIRLAPLALLALTACSDHQIASAVERHRAYVCAHQAAVTLAATAVIDHAGSISDANIRAAAVAIARADLGIVAGCSPAP